MSDLTSLSSTTLTPAAPAPVAPAAPVETFSREYVEQLRSEAAGYRTGKNDAVAAAKAEADTAWQAKLDTAATEHTATTEELSSTKLALLKLNEVLKAEIPNNLVLTAAELVQGTDESTVTESVKKVKAILGAQAPKDPAVDPSQGSGGGGVIPLNGDPILDKLKSVVGVR